MTKRNLLFTALIAAAFTAPSAFAQEVDAQAVRDAERAAQQAAEAVEAAEAARHADHAAHQAQDKAEKTEKASDEPRWTTTEEEEEDPA